MGGTVTFTVPLNFSAQLYFKLLSYATAIQETDDRLQQIKYIKELTLDIIRLDTKRLTYKWIDAHISIDDQILLISEVIAGVNEIINDDIFVIPDIKVNKEEPDTKSNEQKKRQQKQKRIKRLTEITAKYTNVSFVPDIVFLMQNTANSYHDIMVMPILVYRALVRQMYLNLMRTDEDYNLAYLEKQYREIEKELNNDTAMNRPQK